MKSILNVLLALVLLLTGATVMAQTPKWDDVTSWDKKPRLEDHFWRKRVRTRIDLLEKINIPMDYTENIVYDQESRKVYNANKDQWEFNEPQGIRNALINAYANQLIRGYKTDTLDNEFTFPQFRAEYNKRLDKVATGEGATDEGDEFGEGDGGDDWGFEDSDETSGDTPGDVIPTGSDPMGGFTDIAKVFDILEDRILDRNKSDMYYDIQYVILYTTSPTITEPIVAFRYDEIKDLVLDKCKWKNRFNDSEYKTLKEIFELRLFTGTVINVSGLSPQNLYEAEKRRLQMLEFEHNLWEF